MLVSGKKSSIEHLMARGIIFKKINDIATGKVLHVALAWALILMLSASAQAQIMMTLELPRTQFVLYEPVVVKLTIINSTGRSQTLENKNGSAWLGFIIQRADGSAVFPDQENEWPTVVLGPGESKTLKVNVTPLFSFRDTGQYEIRAVVHADGSDFVSAFNRFTIVNGHKIWQELKIRPGEERLFSMIRFSPGTAETLLFIRVESHTTNMVYATYPLGPITMLATPDRLFDGDNKLHVLHPIGNGAFKYSRIDYDGRLEYDAKYVTTGMGRPKLQLSDDKTVIVTGGRLENKENDRVRISETQKYIELLIPNKNQNTKEEVNEPAQEKPSPEKQ